MATCPQCARPVDDGALFCGECGHTIPQASGAEPAAPPFTPPTPSYLTLPPPPPDWIPPSMRGVARHCVRCNTLISAVAVVCPVCQAPQPEAGGAGGAAAPVG